MPPPKLMVAEVARNPDAALERPTDVRELPTMSWTVAAPISLIWPQRWITVRSDGFEHRRMGRGVTMVGIYDPKSRGPDRWPTRDPRRRIRWVLLAWRRRTARGKGSWRSGPQGSDRRRWPSAGRTAAKGPHWQTQSRGWRARASDGESDRVAPQVGAPEFARWDARQETLVGQNLRIGPKRAQFIFSIFFLLSNLFSSLFLFFWNSNLKSNSCSKFCAQLNGRFEITSLKNIYSYFISFYVVFLSFLSSLF
jgi:hypothetical protein